MDARYPIGKFDVKSTQPLGEAIGVIEAFPAELRSAVERLSERQLDTPYREGGWTARQVIHHLADSHLNSAVRFRLALTEDQPVIKVYDEKKWAELADAKSDPVEPSVVLIDGLHRRWASLLKSMRPDDFEREIVHPERGGMTLGLLLRIYAWHCRHHLAHIAISAQAGDGRETSAASE